MGNVGRGGSYSKTRRFVEDALMRVYVGGWPARAARAAGFQRRVRIVEHSVACPAWPRGAPPLTIAFASDFHAGPTTHPALLDLACDAITRARPDVILLGGDYVFLDARHIAMLAERLARLRAPHGIFAVLGNHDLWADNDHIERALASAGVRVLVNESATLAPPFDHVSICGIDDPWVGVADAGRAFGNARARDVRVLLMHAPEGLMFARGHRFDLALCGHTHGGHVALPGGVPIVSVGPLSRRYAHGAHALEGGGTLIVSRGIGGIEIPIRLFADPDVVVCTLTGS
jgi:predicted MPP superfamily phosphohydrolase